MKKIILILILALGMIGSAYSATRNIQDNYLFTYAIIDVNGDPVTGQTAALMIQKSSNGYWLDFSDHIFKNSGWVQKTTNLSYDTDGGFYYYLYDPPVTEDGAEQYVFVVDNDSVDYADHQQDTVEYQEIASKDDVKVYVGQ